MPESPLRRRMPLTLRLVMGSTLVCGTCLLGVGWLSIHTLHQRFDRKNASLLADHLAEVRQTVFDHPGDLHEVAELILISSASHQVNSYYGQLTDASGEVVAATPEFGQVVPPGTVFPATVGSDEIPEREQQSRLTVQSGELFLLAAKVRQSGGAPELLYQVALNAGHVEEWLANYNRTLGIFIAIATAASALLSWLVARSGLAPLRDITQSVQQVSAPGLTGLLGVRPWPAELAALAGEFDRMLGRLDDSFNRLSQFTADAAHEFRTPLSNLTGSTSLLLTRERSVAEYREILEAHLKQYERLNRMIESLLFLARADGKTVAPQIHPLAAGHLLCDIAEFFAPLAEESGVNLTIDGDATLLADESLLRMVLINLIANALRVTPPGGTIALGVNRDETGHTLVTIADTGCGIAPQHLSKIFDRFYRVDAARSSSGTGLGLALVQTIMKLHCGSVTVTSKANCGSTFQLVFPDAMPPD